MTKNIVQIPLEDRKANLVQRLQEFKEYVQDLDIEAIAAIEAMSLQIVSQGKSALEIWTNQTGETPVLLLNHLKQFIEMGDGLVARGVLSWQSDFRSEAQNIIEGLAEEIHNHHPRRGATS